jgi:para-nitrobenzyl esterase
LPVLFYIHGGAFNCLSGAFPVFDGAHLAAAQDVIVVTSNYRLGPLGFAHFGSGAANFGLQGTI